jgi:PAS domain S-box-containing protein
MNHTAGSLLNKGNWEQGKIGGSALDPALLQIHKEILENLEGIFWVSQAGHILYTSPGYEKIWGVPLEELYKDPESFLSAVHPEDQERVRKAIEMELTEGHSEVEYRIIPANGTVRWIHARSFPIYENDVMVRTVGIARDVTRQTLLEERLAHENKFRESVIENAADGICVCHEIEEYPYVHFTVWNRRMTEITGYNRADINRLGWYQTVYPNPETQALATQRMEEMRQGIDLTGEEWTITRVDGTERVLSISTSSILMKDGVRHVLGIMHDVTGKRRDDEKIRQTLALLEAKHRELEQSNMALKVLLKKRDEDREELRQSILTNLRHMVLPHIQKLRQGQASREINQHYCDMIERNLNDMASSFIWELSNRYLNLTPAEIRAAELLKKGLSTKEIAQELGVAPSTINTHRESLRRKLGITGVKTNLTTFLRTLK